MIVYGRNPVREALRGSRAVANVWATRAAAKDSWLEALTNDRTFAFAEGNELDSLAGTSDHQGVCAEVEEFRYADARRLLESDDALVLVLDEVQDPQNLGALARVAECAGASGIVIPERRTAEVTPAACKASAGAVEHLPIARVTNIADYLVSAKESGAWVYGAAADASASYTSPDYTGKVVIVMGSEGKGLRPRVAGCCDMLVSLPVRGKIDSLNVSTAAAVLLYAVLQDRVQ